MKERIDLDKRKRMTLDILMSIDQFCKNNDIKYFITGGTLLGAVRHHGFIPWDDDIDIFIPRQEYNKFIRNYIDDNGNYKLLSWENDNDYFHPFAKVIDTRTVLISTDLDYKEMGIFVDIFPLEYLCDDYQKIKKTYLKIGKLRDKLYYKHIKYSFFSNPIKKIMLFCFKATHFYLKSNRVNQKILELCESVSSNNPTYVASLTTMTYGEKEIMDADLFKELTLLDFENVKLPAPKKYHDILSHFYGNYMQLPPEEKRVAHEQAAYYKENQ